jgi:hypothetical protein
MSDKLESYLNQAKARLNRLVEKAASAGQTESSPEIQRIRMLQDLIKEQTPDENTGHTTRTTR